MNAGSSLQSEGLRTDQMVPGVRTQPPPPHHDGWSVYGEWVREGSVEQGGGGSNTGLHCTVWSGLVSDVIMGQTYNFMPRLCHLCCAAVVSVG